jgi:hypothetical protein
MYIIRYGRPALSDPSRSVFIILFDQYASILALLDLSKIFPKLTPSSIAAHGRIRSVKSRR